MSRRFKNVFRPDAGRLPIAKEDLRKMMFGIPAYFKEILKSPGLPDFTAEEFNRMLTGHLEPCQPFLGRKEHLRLLG